MSFEVESDLEALDDEQSDEESVADDVDEDEDTPPKLTRWLSGWPMVLSQILRSCG